MSTSHATSIAMASLLAFAAIPAQAQTPDLTFRGVPQQKVESYEDEDVRYQLDSEGAAEAKVVIVATEEGCV